MVFENAEQILCFSSGKTKAHLSGSDSDSWEFFLKRWYIGPDFYQEISILIIGAPSMPETSANLELHLILIFSFSAVHPDSNTGSAPDPSFQILRRSWHFHPQSDTMYQHLMFCLPRLSSSENISVWATDKLDSTLPLHHEALLRNQNGFKITAMWVKETLSWGIHTYYVGYSPMTFLPSGSMHTFTQLINISTASPKCILPASSRGVVPWATQLKTEHVLKNGVTILWFRFFVRK